MASGDRSSHTGIRYQPDERPPHLLSAGMGVQAAMLVLAGIVLTPAIVIRAADQDETYMTWAIFAALVVSGTTTVLQAVRLGRFGSGHVLIMGTSGAFIAVCVAALVEGGPALLATLVIVSSLFQFALSARLSLLRRILTPVVSGTVIMLIAVTIMPIAFDMLSDVPEGTPPAAAPVTAAATLVAVAALGLRATGTWRLWSPVVGIVVGCGVASLFGLYDVERIASSPWVGVPAGGWQGFEWSLGASFWALLPAFVFVTLVGAIETIGDAVAIQRVSWRNERAVDFRTVQGAVAADGVGNLLSGVAGTVPNTTYSSSIPLAEMTGVASRNVGVYIGIVLAVLAFMPKLTALPLAIPNPVAAAYLTMLLALLFIQGMRIVVQDGIDYRKATVAGLGFWIGTGFQNKAIFADSLGETWGVLLGNGMTTGGLVAIVLTLFMELTRPRRRRIEMELDRAAVPRVEAFLRECAGRLGWSAMAVERLCLAGEETLLSLGMPEEGEEAGQKRRLLLFANRDASALELEFVAAIGDENLEDMMVLLGERAEAPDERELSLRLLRHVASSVRHQQYHDTDIVTVRVEGEADPE